MARKITNCIELDSRFSELSPHIITTDSTFLSEMASIGTFWNGERLVFQGPFSAESSGTESGVRLPNLRY